MARNGSGGVSTPRLKQDAPSIAAPKPEEPALEGFDRLHEDLTAAVADLKRVRDLRPHVGPALDILKSGDFDADQLSYFATEALMAEHASLTAEYMGERGVGFGTDTQGRALRAACRRHADLDRLAAVAAGEDRVFRLPSPGTEEEPAEPGVSLERQAQLAHGALCQLGIISLVDGDGNRYDNRLADMAVRYASTAEGANESYLQMFARHRRDLGDGMQ
jgi:hypothetical protein